MDYLHDLRRALILAIGAPLVGCGGIAIVDEGGEGGSGGQGSTTSTGTACVALTGLTACLEDAVECPAIGSPDLEENLARALNQSEVCEEGDEFCSCSWTVAVVNCTLPGRLGCCFDVTASYQVFCEGLPFVVDGAARTAGVRARRDWSTDVALASTDVPETQRLAIAALWQRDATFEHASVASFARLVLELLAFGAPPDLISASTRAMSEEIRHARAAFGVASALLGAPVGPGDLAVEHALTDRLEASAFVRAIVREGCIGETIAAAIAARARECVADPECVRAITMIAEDEASHAALSFRILKFCIERFGDVAIDAAREELNRAPVFAREDGSLDATFAHRFGQLLPSEQADVADRTFRDLVLPIAREALTARSSTASVPS